MERKWEGGKERKRKKGGRKGGEEGEGKSEEKKGKKDIERMARSPWIELFRGKDTANM